MISLVSTSNLAMPNLSKPRNLETHLEDGLFGGNHGPKLSADTLLWMLQHFHHHCDKAVTLEVICALNLYQHRGSFIDDYLDLVRKAIARRDRFLACGRLKVSQQSSGHKFCVLHFLHRLTIGRRAMILFRSQRPSIVALATTNMQHR